MEKPAILRNKVFLYLTEFFSGMSVMAVELGASRLLAPYFSSSQIVWTIIIGTIMIAMALGNIYGGRSADKNPNPDRLYARILVAAIWIAAIPVLGKYVILLVSGLLIFTVSSNFLTIAAFAACMIIFVFPLFLLGTVTPSLAKYTVDSLEGSGKTVGNLGAFNTIGSIIGTFLPTFVTIPAVGTSVTFLIFAGILLVLCVVYFISAKRGKVKMGVSAGLFVLCCIFGHSNQFVFWEEPPAYEGESVYNYLQVKDGERSVVLSTNVLFGVQSVYMKEEGLTGMYYDYAMAAPLMAGGQEEVLSGEEAGSSLEGGEAAGRTGSLSLTGKKEPSEEPSGGEEPSSLADKEILILGMGTGTYAVQCQRYFGNHNIEGVEIDEKITELSRKYFNLPEDVKVTTYDGRAYLNADEKKYDVIMVDAYQDITIPFQMSSVEFFTLVKEHLKEDGVMVVNMNMRGKQEGSINQYLADTIASVFQNVYTIDVKGSTNRELFAGNHDFMLQNMEAQTERLSNPELRDMMQTVLENLSPYEAGSYLMTDDKAPVELLGMQVIDDLIREEVEYYRDVYEEKGFSGLLEVL